MPHRSKNVVLWNLLIRAYAWNGPFEEAIDLYYKMLGYGITPNRFTFPFVLKACSALKEVDGGREIHFEIKRLRLESNVYVSTALVDFYAKCGCLDDAKEVFDKMPKRDVVAWNSMISGFSLHEGSYDEVVRLLVEMQNDTSPNSSTIVGVLPAVAQVNSLRHGKEIHGFCVRMGFVGDVVVGTGILDVYGKCQRIDYARRIFDMMGIVKNEVTWSAMAGAYVVCNFMREALELFCQLLMLKDDGIVLSAVTLATVTGVCAKLTDLSMGSCLHCYAIKSGFVLDLMVGNTLLSMYAKCGIINGAMSFFNEMYIRDAVSYTAIISGYVQNGNSEEGLRMFLEMQLSGINPEKATMASVLSACSHLAALHYGSCSHCHAILCDDTYAAACPDLANRDMSRRKRLLRLRGTVAANMRIYVPVSAFVVWKDDLG
ncbi:PENTATRICOPEPTIDE REPEAT-CONTAINING PROTEIN [Salix koriyanagi]|uniref:PENTATRICOPEPTIDE REPEAT-CONTAINING PROTEIN n=1 Tax=Salix koriyanagi TaxID=2511006 RepID=A0A9Q0T0I2_9ROSI|nr:PENTATRICOPEPTIDE REPEAT-CONTAINING PROTEIN [Salix koriyanagi]